MCLSRKSVMTTYRPKMELMSWVCVCVSVSECLCECLFLYVWMSDVFCVCDAKKAFPSFAVTAVYRANELSAASDRA